MDTPTQIDPSKVKAGDTVTLERDTALARDIVERIEPYPQGGYSIVLRETTPAYLTVTGWLVTDHKPAPDPTGPQFGHALVSEQSVHGFMTTGQGTDPIFVFPMPDSGYMTVSGDAFSDFVPDEPRPAVTREERANVVDLLIAFSNGRADEWDTADKIIAYLRGESR